MRLGPGEKQTRLLALTLEIDRAAYGLFMPPEMAAPRSIMTPSSSRFMQVNLNTDQRALACAAVEQLSTELILLCWVAMSTVGRSSASACSGLAC